MRMRRVRVYCFDRESAVRLPCSQHVSYCIKPYVLPMPCETNECMFACVCVRARACECACVHVVSVSLYAWPWGGGVEHDHPTKSTHVMSR